VAQALLITLREGLEISLLIVIILAYLKGTGRTQLFGAVWRGTGLAVAVSIVAGAILVGLGVSLEGAAEEVFEGSAMFLAVIVLSWMILWMKSQARHIRGEIEARVEQALARGSTYAIASVAFLIVVREGLETALFLFSASKTATPVETTIGGIIGLVVAIVIGRLVYQGSRSINLRLFFNITGVLLIFVAAGLLAHGIHEFQEAGVLYVFIEHVWDINHILNEDGLVGSILGGLFGYNGNPSLLEVIAYPIYLVTALYLFLKPVPSRSGSPMPGIVTTSN
jgi:high-affinity iron transporter